VVFYYTRDAFAALPGPRWIKPAIGGLLTGLVGLALPQILGGGYGWMQLAIDGRLALGLLLTLSVAKMVTLSFTVGSGGSGGIFAPSLYVGAMLGAALATAAGKAAAPVTIVGMAAVFAGAAHVPFATMMMVTEMTGGYDLLVPAALAVLVSYLVQRRLSQRLRYNSIDEAQVRSRGDSPAHHTQHLEIALRILREKQVSGMNGIGNLDLVSLLRAGVPVDLGGNRQLFVGRLRDGSPTIGSTIATSGRRLAGEDTNIIAILRGEHMMAPRGDTVLQSGDRLVLVASVEGVEELKQDLDVW
jgi:CIC family chloride channel protein